MTRERTTSNIINQNEEQAVQSSSQGQLEDNDGGKNARFSSITTTEGNSTTGKNVCPSESTMECDQSTLKMNISCTTTTTSLQTASIKLPHEQPSTSTKSQQSNSDNETRPLSSEQSSLCTAESDSKEMIEQQDSSSSQEQQLPNIGTGPASPDVSQPQVAEVLPSEEEEPLPIIQETVVQHFPNTTEEEANELAPVQIRPEFLRILQEADEATNANSLDWMPSLSTITHSVALSKYKN